MPAWGIEILMLLFLVGFGCIGYWLSRPSARCPHCARGTLLLRHHHAGVRAWECHSCGRTTLLYEDVKRF